MKKILLPALVAVLVGCATQAKFETMLGSWVGADENRLVSEWGPPDSTYAMSDGSKILTYSRAGQQFIPGYANATTTTYGKTSYTQVSGMPNMMISQNCKIDWTVRPDGRVSNWRWEGNSCKSR